MEIRKLLSKVQFKNYETGEFSNSAFRTFEETCELIENYPWPKARHLAPVGLTGPSATVELNHSSFFKIGPYYSGKFILYLYTNGKLFTKITQSLEDYKAYLLACFDHENAFPLQDFNLEKKRFQIEKHFKTASFKYTPTFEHAFRFVLLPTLSMFLAFILVATGFLTRFDPKGLIFLIGLSLIVSAPNIFLFFNYLTYCQDKVLIVSKGRNDFYFRYPDHLHSYSKTDIQRIEMTRHRGHKNIWNHCIVYTLFFKDGTTLKFPSLLMSLNTFFRKFEQIEIIETHKFYAKI